MDRFTKFELFLAELLANPEPEQAVVSQLQLKLERARPQLVNLLKVEPKNQQQRERLLKREHSHC